jgi:hypothetical protein
MYFSCRTITKPAEGVIRKRTAVSLDSLTRWFPDPDITGKLKKSTRMPATIVLLGCWALTEKRFRAFDDGGPNDSAGDPILESDPVEDE